MYVKQNINPVCCKNYVMYRSGPDKGSAVCYLCNHDRHEGPLACM